MLDTNIISYLIRSKYLALIDTFENVSKKATIGVSSITVAELFYGVKKKSNSRLEIAVKELLYPLEKFAFDDNAASTYGDIRVELERQGNLIGPYDMVIAAHAQSIGAVLVTNNVREFERVKTLKIGFSYAHFFNRIFKRWIEGFFYSVQSAQSACPVNFTE